LAWKDGGCSDVYGGSDEGSRGCAVRYARARGAGPRTVEDAAGQRSGGGPAGDAARGASALVFAAESD